jgi:DNA invertase Pin-like site-specific DNA recombinase
MKVARIYLRVSTDEQDLQYIHFFGRYLFRGNRHAIDLEVLLVGAILA